MPTKTHPQIVRRTANDGRVVLEDIPEIPSRFGDLLRPFHNIRSATLQDFSGDGRSLYITTRFADTQQLHRIDAPGGARHQLTFFKEPVQEVCRRPGAEHDCLAFLMDRGGDESYQIHLYFPGTGELRALTDDQGRNASLLWSPDGKWLACRSTRSDLQSNDIWLVDPEDPTVERKWVDAPQGTWLSPAAWSPDGRWLAVQIYRSVTDRATGMLDVESGDFRIVAGEGSAAGPGAAGPGAAGPGVYDPLAFSADGKALFIRTDHDGDFNRLARLNLDPDASSGALDIVTDDLPWDISGFALSGDRAAFVANRHGYGDLYLFDPQSAAFSWVDQLPKGLVSHLRFSPDGRRLGFTLDHSTGPGDVWTLDLETGADLQATIQRWTRSEVGGLPASTFVEPELIHYPTFDTLEESTLDDDSEERSFMDGATTARRRRTIPAFVYRPTTEGPHPVVLRIHGGPESQYRPGFNGSVQAWVDRLGLAVIAPNVRGSSGYGARYLKLDNGKLREDSVKDIGALLDWIELQDDLDSERVAVYGGSYGGYMVLASLIHFGDRLRCGVDLVGISNFVTFLENTKAYRRDLRRVEYGDERDPGMRAFLDQISPTRHAARIISPLFVAQGHNDPRVPYSEAEQIVRDVRKTGQVVWFMDALDEGHGFRKKDNRDLFDQAVVAFLTQHLSLDGI